MNVRIAASPDSWGVWFPDDDLQTPWRRFLDEAVEAGFEWTELGPYGYLPTDLSVLRPALESRNLRLCGAFAMEHLDDTSLRPEVDRQVNGAGELLAALGAGFLVLIDGTYTDQATGEPTAPRELSSDAWKLLIDTVHDLSDTIRGKFGLQLVFHPHAETHVEYEDQIETFLEQTDPDRVSLCLDIGHHAYRGGDPVDFMRRNHDRVGYMHLKSVDANIRRRVESEGIVFARAVGMDIFCEPSEGAIDFRAFRDVLEEVDYDGWAVVEQDMYPAPFDKPLPIARRTRAYLREIGIG